ncbi:MAG: hypothetical protein HUU60_06475 [Armatimonadetes bacterium]|nr:hypothetical protein [Armatimonadota bacterium]
MDSDCEFDLDLHKVKKVVEVGAFQAANELLSDDWALHDVYVDMDGRSAYILLRTSPLVCPRCKAPAEIEVSEDRESFRYVCSRECA